MDRFPWVWPLSLGTGARRTVRKSDSRAYCTKITAVGPRGDCPLFLKFLTKIMGGDEALIAYLRRVFGYCLTGDASEQALFFNYGGGANGKTVLMSTVSGILGDYCMATPIETFTESKTSRISAWRESALGAPRFRRAFAARSLLSCTTGGGGRHARTKATLCALRGFLKLVPILTSSSSEHQPG